MKKTLFVLLVGLLPIWIAVPVVLKALPSDQYGASPWLLVLAAFACAVTLPIALGAAAVHSLMPGSNARKFLAATVSFVALCAAAYVMFYRSDAMTGRREARIDQQHALEYAKANATLAEAAGGTSMQVSCPAFLTLD